MTTTAPDTRGPEVLSAIHAAADRPSRRLSLGKRLGRFVHQLRARKVCRAAAAYAITTWLALQIGEVLFPALGLPDWALTLVVVLAVMGFPIVMFCAWILEWTPDGIVIDAEPGTAPASSPLADRVLSAALLATGLAISALVLHGALAGEAAPARREAPGTVAVLSLSSAGVADDAATASALAVGLESELRARLSARAAAPRLVHTAGGSAAGADCSLLGSVSVAGERVRIVVHLVDTASGRYLWSQAFDARNGDLVHLQGAMADVVARGLERFAGAGRRREAVDVAAVRPVPAQEGSRALASAAR